MLIASQPVAQSEALKAAVGFQTDLATANFKHHFAARLRKVLRSLSNKNVDGERSTNPFISTQIELAEWERDELLETAYARWPERFCKCVSEYPELQKRAGLMGLIGQEARLCL